jgi:hypothetical protein
MWVNFEKALVLKNIKIKDDVMICANIYNRMFPLKMDLRFGWIEPNKNPAQRADPFQKWMAAASGLTQSCPNLGRVCMAADTDHWPLAVRPFSVPGPHVIGR